MVRYAYLVLLEEVQQGTVRSMLKTEIRVYIYISIWFSVAGRPPTQPMVFPPPVVWVGGGGGSSSSTKNSSRSRSSCISTSRSRSSSNNTSTT